MLRVTHYTHSLSRQPPATTKDVGCPCAADGRLREGGQLKPAAKSMLEWSAHYVHQSMTDCSVMVLCHALFIQDSPQAAHHQPPLRKWAVQLLSVHFMSRGGWQAAWARRFQSVTFTQLGPPPLLLNHTRTGRGTNTKQVAAYTARGNTPAAATPSPKQPTTS